MDSTVAPGRYRVDAELSSACSGCTNQYTPKLSFPSFCGATPVLGHTPTASRLSSGDDSLLSSSLPLLSNGSLSSSRPLISNGTLYSSPSTVILVDVHTLSPPLYILRGQASSLHARSHFNIISNTSTSELGPLSCLYYGLYAPYVFPNAPRVFYNPPPHPWRTRSREPLDIILSSVHFRTTVISQRFHSSSYQKKVKGSSYVYSEHIHILKFDLKTLFVAIGHGDSLARMSFCTAFLR